MAKRANGEGSYYHIQPVQCFECPDRINCRNRDNPDVACSRRDRQDRWCYQYTVVDAYGKRFRRKLYAKTKRALVARVEKMQAESGDDYYRRSITVGDWFNAWLDRYLPDTVQSNTEQYYRNMIKYVPEHLREKKLSQVTPIMLQRVFTELLEHGRIKDGGALSVSCVRKVRSAMGTAMEAAVDNGYLLKNPVKKTKPPVSEEDIKEVVYLDDEEIKRLLKVADSGEYYDGYPKILKNDAAVPYLVKCYSMVVRLTLATGLRRGEVFGLTWSCVDFTSNTIFVKNNLQGRVLKKPKTTHSIRCIMVDKATMRRLLEWQKSQEKYAKSVGDLFKNKHHLLFTNRDGGPVLYDNFRRRQWEQMRKKAMLPEKCTFHSLRHTHATHLLKKGINPKVISKRLGHSSVYFTMATYTHVLPEMDKTAAEAIASVLDETE